MKSLFSSAEFFLWKKRFLYDWKNSNQVLKLVFDWVVVVYIVVPILVFGTVFYFQGLTYPPDWWNADNAGIILTGLFIVTGNKKVRPLFSLGDEGFLFASPLSPRRFLLFSWLQSLAGITLIAVILWNLLTPYLILLNWHIWNIISLAIYWILAQGLLMQLEWLGIGRSKILYYLNRLFSLLIVVALWGYAIQQVVGQSPITWVISILFMAVFGGLLVYRNIQYRWPWSVLIQESVEQRRQLISLVLGGNPKKGLNMKPKRPARWLKGGLGLSFRQENAINFWYIKSFLRNSNYYLPFLQASLYSLIAIYLISIWWVSLIVLIVVVHMLVQLLLGPYKQQELPWMAQYPFTYEQKEKGLTHGMLILMCPVVLLASMLITLHLGQWFLFLPIFLFSILIAWVSMQLQRNSIKYL